MVNGKLGSITNLPNCRYAIIGKICVVSIVNAVFTNDDTNTIDLGLPRPSSNGVITLRDTDNGYFSSFWLRVDNGFISTYRATNYVSGHTYSGFFTYLIP